MWIRDRDAFLDELHWRHGRGCNIKTDSCDACLQSDSLTSPSTQTVRCIDCTFSPMLCSHLMVQAHKSLPLHRIEVSKPFTSVKCRLSPFTDLERRLFCIDESERTGLTVRLGHNGAHCPEPAKSSTSLTVIHVNGIHDLSVSFCGCSESLQTPRWCQLMRIGWYPATTSHPETCSTFETLQQCHLLIVHSKLSTFQFYNAILRLTDNTGLSVPPVCA